MNTKIKEIIDYAYTIAKNSRNLDMMLKCGKVLKKEVISELNHGDVPESIKDKYLKDFNKKRVAKNTKDKKACSVCDGTYLGDVNNKFDTRCPSCVYLKLYKNTNRLSGLIYIPQDKLDLRNRIMTVVEESDTLGSDLTNIDALEYISSKIGLSVAKIKATIQLENLMQPLRLDELNLQYVENGTHKHINEYSYDHDSEFEHAELSDMVNVLLGRLSDREQAIMRMRYGIVDDRTERTLEEIANVLNVTRGRVNQIESTATKKLRHPKIYRHIKQQYLNGTDMTKPTARKVVKPAPVKTTTPVKVTVGPEDKIKKLVDLLESIGVNLNCEGITLQMNIMATDIDALNEILTFVGDMKITSGIINGTASVSKGPHYNSYILPEYTVTFMVIAEDGIEMHGYLGDSKCKLNEIKKLICTTCIKFIEEYSV